MASTIQIDGRVLEGGGQILRIALCLSALTGTPIKIDNIRGARAGGTGLKKQHLTCVNWLARACNAEVTGAALRSTTLTFSPRSLEGISPAYARTHLSDGRIMFERSADVGSAGSTALVLQAILPYVLFTSPQLTNKDGAFVRLRMGGGTNVSHSPSFEYVKQVLLPTLEAIGLPAMTAQLDRRGWSTGAMSVGSFTLDIPIMARKELPAFSYMPNDTQRDPPKPSRIDVTFLGPSSSHEHFQKALTPAVQRCFGKQYSTEEGNLTISCEDSRHDKRLYLIMVAVVDNKAGDKPRTYRLAADEIYTRKIHSTERSITEMVKRVRTDLFEEWKSGAWVDEHMRDQLAIFAALANGESKTWEGRGNDGLPRLPSLHARTAQWVIKLMLKKDEGIEQLTKLSLDG